LEDKRKETGSPVDFGQEGWPEEGTGYSEEIIRVLIRIVFTVSRGRRKKIGPGNKKIKQTQENWTLFQEKTRESDWRRGQGRNWLWAERLQPAKEKGGDSAVLLGLKIFNAEMVAVGLSDNIILLKREI